MPSGASIDLLLHAAAHMWPDVGIKSSPKFLKGCKNYSHQILP